jgi:ketosteroid isomerase-like protein
MPKDSTSPDLVELTRRSLEVGALRDIDAGIGFFGRDAVWEVPALGTSLVGLTAIRGFLEDWLRAFEEFEIELKEVLDLGNGVVFAVVQTDALPLGGASRTRLREVFVYVVVWREGKVSRVTVYPDIDGARTAAKHLAEKPADV